MVHVIIDPDSRSLSESYALIKTPRVDRRRYPEACVTIVDSEADARAGADKDKNLHPARVYGPSSSSESQRIYYLIRWLS